MTDTHTSETAADETPPRNDKEAARKQDTLFSEFLAVSHQLRDAFEPVEPSPAFVSQLRQQLHANVDHARDVFRRHARRRKRLKWTALGVGAAAYMIGLGIVLIRAGRRLVARRQRTPSAGA